MAAERVGKHPVGGFQQGVVGVHGLGTDLLGGVGQRVDMAGGDLPVANFSLTFGMSESCLATLAIRFDSRVGIRAPCRNTSAGSASVLAAAILSVRSYIRDADIDLIRPRSRSVRSASSWDMAPMRARSRAASAAAMSGSRRGPHRCAAPQTCFPRFRSSGIERTYVRYP